MFHFAVCTLMLEEMAMCQNIALYAISAAPLSLNVKFRSRSETTAEILRFFSGGNLAPHFFKV